MKKYKKYNIGFVPPGDLGVYWWFPWVWNYVCTKTQNRSKTAAGVYGWEGGRRRRAVSALSGAAGPPVIEACRGLAGRQGRIRVCWPAPMRRRHQRGFQRLPGADGQVDALGQQVGVGWWTTARAAWIRPVSRGMGRPSVADRVSRQGIVRAAPPAAACRSRAGRPRACGAGRESPFPWPRLPADADCLRSSGGRLRAAAFLRPWRASRP